MIESNILDRIDEEFLIGTEQDRSCESPVAILKNPIKEFSSYFNRLDMCVVHEEDVLQFALEKMIISGTSCILVVDQENRLTGIITERDFTTKVLSKQIDTNKTPVTAIMSYDPIRLTESDLLIHAVSNMIVGGFRHIPIVNHMNQPVAVVSVREVATIILDECRGEIVNIPPTTYRGPSERDAA